MTGNSPTKSRHCIGPTVRVQTDGAVACEADETLVSMSAKAAAQRYYADRGLVFEEAVNHASAGRSIHPPLA
jgi:hypothetical protein